MAPGRRAHYHAGPPADDAQLAAAEAELGVPVPSSLREMYREFDGLWTDDRGSTSAPGGLDDYLVLPLARLRAARDRLEATYTRSEGAEWAEQVRRCVPFYTPESGASFLFVTDLGAWGVPPSHVGQFDHDGGVSDSWDSLAEWLRHLGRPWEQDGADMHSEPGGAPDPAG